MIAFCNNLNNLLLTMYQPFFIVFFNLSAGFNLWAYRALAVHSHKSVDDYSDLSTLIKYAIINRANTIRLLVIGENEVKILSSNNFLLTAVWRLKINLLWYVLR